MPATINEGDCVDAAYFEGLFDEIATLAECATTESTQFQCRPVRVFASNFDANSEFCLTIYAPPLDAPSNDEPEDKILLFTFDTGIQTNRDPGDSGGTITSTYRIDIRCDGVTVDSKDRFDAVGDIIMSTFSCPPSSEIEICIVSTFIATGFNSSIRALRTFSACGSLVCLSQASGADDTSGLFLPGPLPEGCKYGREALHLALQNLDALQGIFSQYGQVPSAQALDFNDLDDHVVLSSVSGDTPYLVIGSVYLCARNDTTRTQSITVRPRVVCGIQVDNCLVRTLEIPPRESGTQGPTRCIRVPVVSCGICPAGSDIITAVRPQVACDEDVVQVNPGSIVDIVTERQSYCVYTFEPQQNEFSERPRASLGNCPTVETFASIQTIIDELLSVCSSISPNNVTDFQDEGVAAIGTPVQLVAPFTPPPPALPGTRTWFITATAFASGPQLSINQVPVTPTEVEVTMQILCGGVVAQESSQRWRIIDAGSSSVNSYFRTRTLPPISGCVRCRSDEAIEILFTASLIFGDGSVLPVTAAYQADGFFI